jgi:hypothetical protein
MQGSPCEAASATVHHTQRISMQPPAAPLEISWPGRTTGAAGKQVASLSVTPEDARVLMHGRYRSTLHTHRPPSSG